MTWLKCRIWLWHGQYAEIWARHDRSAELGYDMVSLSNFRHDIAEVPNWVWYGQYVEFWADIAEEPNLSMAWSICRILGVA